MWLKLKIFFGYTILILLLVFIVYQFRQEQMLRHMLRKEEKKLVTIHRLAEKSYIGLLDLSTHAEIAVIWNDDDLREYSRKRRGVCDSLQLLKEYVHTPLQKSHIDSLCLLLWNKELLLAKAMHTFNELQGIGDIVQESIPAIVSTGRKQAARQKENTVSPGAGEQDTPKKKRSIWDIFRRKENKSAYLQQREETERKRQSLSATPPTGTTTRMLLSLNERVALEQAERQARLLAQMDSLYTGSVELNGRMNNMISEFERENNECFTARYKAFVLERDNSYYMVASFALFVLLLAVVSQMDRLDIAAIMEGEEYVEEMLDIFIEDTTKELSEMRDASSMRNYVKLENIIHETAPLWEMIRINISRRELKGTIAMSPEKWGGI